jgi:serine/threonine protein kinase
MLTTDTVLQDRYRIVSLLGQGGMGAVYHAWDTRLNIPLALKGMVPQPGLDTATLAQVRDLFDTSRKYAQAILEHLDEEGITKRVGDERVLIQERGQGSA